VFRERGSAIEEFVFGESREIDRYRRQSMIDAFPKRQEK